MNLKANFDSLRASIRSNCRGEHFVVNADKISCARIFLNFLKTILIFSAFMADVPSEKQDSNEANDPKKTGTRLVSITVVE